MLVLAHLFHLKVKHMLKSVNRLVVTGDADWHQHHKY